MTRVSTEPSYRMQLTAARAKGKLLIYVQAHKMLHDARMAALTGCIAALDQRLIGSFGPIAASNAHMPRANQSSTSNNEYSQS